MRWPRLKRKTEDAEWKQSLVVTVSETRDDHRYRIELPVQIATDEEGRFVVVPVHDAKFDLRGVDLALEVRMKFSDREHRETLRAALLGRTGSGEEPQDREGSPEDGVAL